MSLINSWKSFLESASNPIDEFIDEFNCDQDYDQQYSDYMEYKDYCSGKEE